MAKKPAPKKAASKGSAVRRATAPPKDEREEDRVKDWFGKIRGADKAYEEWEKRFSVKRGEDYYEGRQWYGLPEADADKRYVINITAAAVETQKPSLLFDNPQIRIEPRPSRKDELSRQTLDDEAKLATQAVQTFIDDPDVKFILETGLGVHEAHFRFGLVEVGYTADFLDNPHAGKPLIPSDPTKAGELPEGAGENTVDTEAEDAATEAGADGEAEAGPLQPDKVVQPGTERIYVKRVPAESFRVSLSGKNDLSANDWVGYFEWVYVSDLKANAKYKNTDDLKSTGTIDQKYRPSANSQDLEAKHGMVKVWKLWDLRGKVKHVLADGHQKFLLEGEPWKIVPFADLKFLERPNHYYPKPVVFDWLSPQDELNEQREQARNHRRRFERKYTYRDGSIEDTELQKLQDGGDGTFAKSLKEHPIEPVPDAPLGAQNLQSGAMAEQDFTMVSGVSGEQRQVATADTATQASIMDSRARLRESAARIKVRNWLGQIGRLMLLHMREHMTLPFIIKQQLDLQTATPEEVLMTALRWQAITAKDLGEVDMEVSVSLDSLSPIVQETERASWNQVLALIANPGIRLMLSFSDALLRKTLDLYGVTSERDIVELKGVMQKMTELEQLAAGAAMEGGSAGVTATAGPQKQPPMLPGHAGALPPPATVVQ